MKRDKIASVLIGLLAVVAMTTTGCEKMFKQAARKGQPVFQAEFNGEKLQEVFDMVSSVSSKVKDDSLVVTAPLADARYVEV